MSLRQLEECFAMGFIQEEEYERRKLLLSAELELETAKSSQNNSQNGSLASSQEFRFDGYQSLPSESQISSKTEQNKKAKGIRVFVSSTFLDMKEERRLLVQNVFPELKRECRKRNINLVYVDFRWGITNEDSAGGNVLDLCLNEIDKCRPYIIGMLGERYGWCKSAGVPDKALAQSFTKASQRFPWVENYDDRSITEIELLFGALFYPQYAHAAYLYFRDPKYSETRPEMKEAHNSAEYHKLSDLKNRIKYIAKNNGLNLRENYKSPQEFAELVLQDLKRQIEKDFPLSSAQVESVIDKEKRFVDNYIDNRASTFISRESELYQIDQFVEKRTKSPLLIFGDRGVGKSSLIAKWISLNNLKDVKLFYSFFGLVHVQSHKNISFVLHAMKEQCHLDKEVSSEPGEVLQSLKEWINLVSEKEKKVVLILDGFDKLDCESLLWLPKEFPSNVRVILTCSPGNKYYDHLSPKTQSYDNQVVYLNPLADSEKRLLIDRYLTLYSKKLSFSQTQQILEAKLSNNPLFLCCLLQRLVMCGDFDTLNRYIDNFTYCRSLEHFFEVVIKEVTQQIFVPDKKNFASDVLNLICLSRYGMVEAELIAIMEVYSHIPWSSLFAALGDMVNYYDGLINFSNSIIKDVISKQLTSDAITRYRQLICSYFKSKIFSERKLLEYPWHLLKLGNSKDLTDFLSSDITILTNLYSPLTKFELFSYLKCTRMSSDASVFVKALEAHKTKVSKEEYARLTHTVGNFMIENGNNDIATKLFQSCLTSFVELYSEFSAEVSDILYDFSRLHLQSAKYQEAITMLERCLKVRTKLLGNEHIKYAECLWMRALIHKKMSEYEDAIRLYEKALAIVEKKLGSSHPQTALYIKTIADVYRLQSNYTRSESLYRDALYINRSNFGDLHSSVAECLDALGKVLKKVGKYQEAKSFYEEALAILSYLYGDNHVSVAETCVNLADVERKMNNYKEAENLYLKAMNIYEAQFGRKHPEVAEICNNLGILFKNTGRLTEALKNIEEGLAILEVTLGSNHPKAARFLNNAADIHAITSRYDIAKEMYLRAMQINEKHLGKDHPEVSENLNALGKLEKKRGNYLDAQKYYERSIAIIKCVFGEEHPKYAFYLNDLGTIYRKTDRMDDAWNCYTIAKDICEKEFGSESPEVANNLNGLARVLVEKNEDLDTAEKYHQDALYMLEKSLGHKNQRVAYTLNLLGELYAKQCKFEHDGADRFFLKALDMNRELFGNEHPEVAENLFGLAGVYIGQLNYPKAEAVLKEAIGITERTLGTAHPHAIKRWAALATLYERMGRVQDSISAWDHQKKIAEIRRKEEASWK